MKKYIKLIVLILLGAILGIVIYSKLTSNQVKLIIINNNSIYFKYKHFIFLK